MARAMPDLTWQKFEATVIRFCEMRAEYRRRKNAGTLGRALERDFIQALNALEIQIERLHSGDELAQARTQPAEQRVVNMKAWRVAQ